MVVQPLAPKWTPRGVLQRFGRVVQEPGDLPLCLYIAAFIAGAPRAIASQNLPAFIARLRTHAPKARAERIVRLRSFVLSRPMFGRANTCYVRALTLYRFLDADENALRVHFGIERREHAGERLHGHAWVTLDGEMLEGPPAVREGRIREIPIPRGLR